MDMQQPATKGDVREAIVEADNRGMTLHGAVLTELQLKLQDHGQRISRLEASR